MSNFRQLLIFIIIPIFIIHVMNIAWFNCLYFLFNSLLELNFILRRTFILKYDD
uniref:Uncharacterized protein n=1 Tax=Lepeophtheirus salmonis TaxID=72036 RepID=A0A0K2VKC1_LEPSM